MFQEFVKNNFERENFIFLILVLLIYFILILSVVVKIIENVYSFVKRNDKKVEINLI